MELCFSRRRRSPVTIRSFFLLCFLIGNSQADWIDPDTPEDARTTEPLNVRIRNLPKSPETPKKSNKTHHPTTSPAPTLSPEPSNGPTQFPTIYPTFLPRTFELVFSDEFNTDEREFVDGADPRWTALDKNDYTNDALHYYSPRNAQTRNGELVITSKAEDTDIIGYDDVKRKRTHVTKHFTSAMLQTWNKFCFTGGIVEAKVTLPGKSNVGGLWPAFWLLGNLARHTYVGSSEHIWPWSSTVCTEKSGYAQALSGCDRVAHYGMSSRLGRGAPEMDIFEVQPGNIKGNSGNFLKTFVGQPFMSSSFQVAPGRSDNRPGPGEWPGPDQWYEGLLGGNNASLNILFYGNYNSFLSDVHPFKQDYWSDAISFNRQLNESYFSAPHVYRLEWDVPTEKSDGYLHWFLDDELVLAINGTGVKKAGLGSEISTEPSYILLNTAISKQWGFPNQCPASCPCKRYDCRSPHWQDVCGFSEGFCDMMTQDEPEYKIDYVRVYQDPDRPEQKVGCSTPERPTRRYINGHEKFYKTEDDDHPLRGIQTGRGNCAPGETSESREACGGTERGKCTQGQVCECREGWTGPHCLSRTGYDSVVYDPPDSIVDVGFVAPQIAPRALWTGLILLIVCILIAVLDKRRLDGWQPIPDAEWKREDPATTAISELAYTTNYE